MRVFLLKLTVHEYIKIIYVNCGLKNYMKVDHCIVKVSVSVSHIMLIFFLHVQWEGLAEPLTKDNNINSY